MIERGIRLESARAFAVPLAAVRTRPAIVSDASAADGARLNGAQRDLFELVGAALCEAYGDDAGTASRQATYLVPVGPHGVRVTTRAVGESDALVELYTGPRTASS